MVDKQEMHFEDFLNDISPAHMDLVSQIHDALLRNGCNVKMQLAKSGHVVSYTDPGTKKTVANFVSRKKGPVVRIYGDYAHKYQDAVDALPEQMQKSVEKAPVCKRMLDPAKCNSRCPMGYAFALKGTHYQKCRYNCFMFEINAENSPFILTLLENELRERVVSM